MNWTLPVRLVRTPSQDQSTRLVDASKQPQRERMDETGVGFDESVEDWVRLRHIGSFPLSHMKTQNVTKILYLQIGARFGPFAPAPGTMPTRRTFGPAAAGAPHTAAVRSWSAAVSKTSRAQSRDLTATLDRNRLERRS